MINRRLRIGHSIAGVALLAGRFMVVTSKLVTVFLAPLVLVGGDLNARAAADGPVAAVPATTYFLDVRSLPGSASQHSRTKWSNDGLLYIDDEPTPLVYVFERSGKLRFSAPIEVPQAANIRLDDYALAPDGSAWAVGHADFRSGQVTSFLAHAKSDGSDVHLFQTVPYFPHQLAVAPDGTVWTAGMVLRSGHNGRFRRDMSEDTLRHFDSSGKQIGSAVPASGVSKLATVAGFLAAGYDRVGWYSPDWGDGSYTEFSPDMKVLHTYPVAHNPTERRSLAERFALTPSGRVFVEVSSAGPGGRPFCTLLELDRTANAWVQVSLPKDSNGDIPWLDGNDGESLIFEGPAPDQIQIFNVSSPSSSPTAHGR